MSTKILVIGIDALDSTTILKHIDVLPNFKKLLKSTGNIKFDGVFPPDSPTSWASIYTGLDPAKHGIVLFVDPLKRVSKMVSRDVDDHTIHGKTFWDIAGKSGKKVCILPHLLGYPVWPVNGIMIGRSGVNQEVQVYPNELSSHLDISKFKWSVDLFPGKNKDKYIELTKYQITREKEFAHDLLKKDEFDIFFVSFGELDSIQYSFWNFYDQDDPAYPGTNRYSRLIPEFYILYDRIIGELWEAAGPDAIVVVVSDHGIGSRPVKLFNVNEFLRREGYLVLKNTKSKLSSISRLEKLKKGLISYVDRYNLGNLAATGLRYFPQSKDWIISSNHINWDECRAYLTDQSGIKNYPYGGIIVNRNPPESYDSIRNALIQKFMEVRDPETGLPIFNWIYKREDLYNGEFIENYPELIFELNESYGAGTSVPDELFDRSVSHNIAPGCHKQHHATFLIFNPGNKKLTKEKMTLMDVTPTLLELLDINSGEYYFDGKNIFSHR